MSIPDDRMLPGTVRSASHQDKAGTDSAVQSVVPVTADPVDSEHPEDEVTQTGSLDLGKHRQKDAPLSTDPEKHVTPHSPSKEFHFPKSN